MNKPITQDQFDRLAVAAALSEIPGFKYSQAALNWKRLCERDERRSILIPKIQESVADIRLNMTYLYFDLEATRRERDELKAKLEALEKDKYFGSYDEDDDENY